MSYWEFPTAGNSADSVIQLARNVQLSSDCLRYIPSVHTKCKIMHTVWGVVILKSDLQSL